MIQTMNNAAILMEENEPNGKDNVDYSTTPDPDHDEDNNEVTVHSEDTSLQDIPEYDEVSSFLLHD